MESNLMKILYIVLGTISLCIGIFGILIPGLPTTPFLLLTAGLYVKSSDRLYKRLTDHKYLGEFILKFNRNGGMTKKDKRYAISLMWIMIILSCLLFVNYGAIQLIVVLAGITGTLIMGFVIPTYNDNE